MISARARIAIVAGFVFVGCLPFAAQAQVGTPVDIGSNQADNTTAVTLSITTTQSAPAGSSIIVTALSISDATPPSGAVCSDSAGNTYNIDTSLNDGLGFTTICSTHGIAAQLPAGSTITITWTGGVDLYNERMHAFSVTGLARSSTLDRTVATAGKGANVQSAPTATTQQANELVFSVVSDEDDSVSDAMFVSGTNGTANKCASTNSNAYSSLGGVGAGLFPSIFGMYCVVSQTGAYSASATLSSPLDDWVALVATYKIAQADVSITKTGPSNIIPGQNAVYTIVVTNNGPDPATAVTVADPTPAGFNFVSNSGACSGTFPCNLGTLNNGQSATITATYLVPLTFTGSSSNTATVTSTTFDPNLLNNVATKSNGPPIVPIPTTLLLVCCGLLSMILWNRLRPRRVPGS